MDSLNLGQPNHETSIVTFFRNTTYQPQHQRIRQMSNVIKYFHWNTEYKVREKERIFEQNQGA